jgi:hypothetical protein
MKAHVHPRDVEALKARLGPAVLSAARTLLSPEAEDLARRWGEYVARRVTWVSAPADFEDGRDLEARLAVLQGPPRSHARPHTVGTVLGAWTIGELHDLLAAKTYEVKQINAAATSCAPAWAAADPTGYGQWAGELYDANQAFAAAQKNAQQVVDFTPQGIWSFTPAGAAWEHLIAAARSFRGLFARMMDSGTCAAPDFSQMPQPTASDLDLRVFKLTDVATKKIEGAATSAVSAVSSRGSWFVLGLAVALGAVVLLKVAR